MLRLKSSNLNKKQRSLSKHSRLLNSLQQIRRKPKPLHPKSRLTSRRKTLRLTRLRLKSRPTLRSTLLRSTLHPQPKNRSWRKFRLTKRLQQAPQSTPRLKNRSLKPRQSKHPLSTPRSLTNPSSTRRKLRLLRRKLLLIRLQSMHLQKRRLKFPPMFPRNQPMHLLLNNLLNNLLLKCRQQLTKRRLRQLKAMLLRKLLRPTRHLLMKAPVWRMMLAARIRHR